MGICIPCRKTIQIANVPQPLPQNNTVTTPKKRTHSFFNNVFVSTNKQIPQNKQTQHQEKNNDDSEILENLLRKKKPKFMHMNSPLIRPKRENYHNSRFNESSSSIHTLENQSLKKILSRSIKIFQDTNNKISQDDNIRSNSLKKNKGTAEFMRNNHSLEKTHTFDYFMPDKRTFRQEMIDTLPHLKLKQDNSSNQKTNKSKNEDKRDNSVQSKEYQLEKIPSDVQTALLNRKINESFSNVSINQSKIMYPNSARIKPSKEYKAQIQQQPGSGLLRMMEKLKNKTSSNDGLKVLHEGKVIILKKNNIIIRNDKVLKII